MVENGTKTTEITQQVSVFEHQQPILDGDGICRHGIHKAVLSPLKLNLAVYER